MVPKKMVRILFILPMLFLFACNDKNIQTNKEVNSIEAETETSTEVEEPTLTLPEQELQKGDQGDAVTALQKILLKIGYPIELSGKYDQDTVWAITDFQFQKDINVTGMYTNEIKDMLEIMLKKERTVQPGTGITYNDKIIKEENAVVTTNPYEVLVLVNKEHALPSDFIPEDLVTPNVSFPFTEDLPKKLLRKPAAEALEKLFSSAEEEGLNLFAQSGYRSYETQEALFTSYVARDGEDAAKKYSARPGQSEHQTGLTMDVTSPDVGFLLNENFGETAEGKWLKENCSEYGFIIRYPKGKEGITGYQYEPWHIRYVGKKAAQTIMEQGITLEEYLDSLQ